MHPSKNLKPEWVNIIRNAAPEAEKAGMLQPASWSLFMSRVGLNF
jgi:hypothetical protein